MKKIAIMGAGGFVGSSLAQYLKERYHVIPVTRKEMDLLNGEQVQQFLEKECPDVVINCANQGGNRKIEATGNAIDIIGNNLKMFFAQERCLTKETKMINFGSGAEYDKTRDLVKIREEEFGTFVPKDDYGYSKYIMERYIRLKNKQDGSVIYNPVIFGLYGPKEDYTFKFISNAIIKNMLKMPIIISQNVVFDYLYIDDFLKIIEHLIESDCPNRTFHITPTCSIDLVSIAKIINDCSNYKSEIIVKNPGLNYEYTGANEKLLENMGGTFAFTSYEKGIGKLYQYYEEHKKELDFEAVLEDKLLSLCRKRQ